MSAPTVASKPASANVFDMLGSTPAPTSSASAGSFASLGTAPLQPMTAQSPNYISATPRPAFNVMSPTNPSSALRSTQLGGNATVTTTASAPTPAKASNNNNNFDDLWSLSLGSSNPSSSSKPVTGGGDSLATGKSIKDLEKEKASASMWGGSNTSAVKVGAGFGGVPAAATSSTLSGGVDDLLL